MDFIALSTVSIASASIVNYYCKEVQNDILIYKISNHIQNIATRAVYKIWQLMPYTKYGNSCQNATSWLVYIGGSLNPSAHPQSS